MTLPSFGDGFADQRDGDHSRHKNVCYVEEMNCYGEQLFSLYQLVFSSGGSIEYNHVSFPIFFILVLVRLCGIGGAGE